MEYNITINVKKNSQSNNIHIYIVVCQAKSPSTLDNCEEAAKKQKIENITTMYVQNYFYFGSNSYHDIKYTNLYCNPNNIPEGIASESITPIIIVYAQQTFEALYYLTPKDLYIYTQPASIIELESNTFIRYISIRVITMTKIALRSKYQYTQ
ncbi:Hypothetical_protein [Hexamita inflata]|uniref:Hypothetical_protein n=1 Tax=Hexamita inflata TaxID=28002 RepID=A0AA86UEG4_9EUKA|nr:Hypothetical protein HINF_LOCUS42555 [Hexamita inflata]